MTAEVGDAITDIEAPDTADSDAAGILEDLEERANELAMARARAEDLQRDLDKLVVVARTYGLRYREIAISTRKSVAWVQASLIRSETAAKSHFPME